VQLVDYLARRRSPARLLWLGSFRVTELIAADHPLATVRQELRLHGLGAELPLDDFTEAEVGEYVASRVPSLAAAPALVRALHDRTDGLPLFVAGVVDDLLARPAPQGDPHERLAAMAMPDTLSGVIERYIEELTPEQRSLLEAASVCGVQFRLSTVARVLDTDAMALAETCAEVTRGQRWLKDLALASNSSPAESGMCSGTRCTVRCSTSAWDGWRASSSIARSQPHSNTNVAKASTSARRSSPRTSTSAASGWRRSATTRRPPNPRCCTSRPDRR
jgi:hypothetical protein